MVAVWAAGMAVTMAAPLAGSSGTKLAEHWAAPKAGDSVASLVGKLVEQKAD